MESHMFGPMTTIMFDASERNKLLGCMRNQLTQPFEECSQKVTRIKRIHTTKSLCKLSRIGCLPASITIGLLFAVLDHSQASLNAYVKHV